MNEDVIDRKLAMDTIEAQQLKIEILEKQLANHKLANEIRQSEGKKKNSRKGKSQYFIKIYINSCKELIMKKKLDTNECALLFQLLPFVQYETNYIVGNDGQCLNIAQLTEIVTFKRLQLTRIIDSLSSKGIIIKIKHGRNTMIQLNENYFYMGER